MDIRECDCPRWCLWWTCIESRLAERITGMQLGWLVRRQLLFGVRTQRESGMVKVSDPKIFFCTPDSYPSLICRPTYTDSAIMESDLKITNIINNFWDFCRHSLLSNAVNFWNMQSLTARETRCRQPPTLGGMSGLPVSPSASNFPQLSSLDERKHKNFCQAWKFVWKTKEQLQLFAKRLYLVQRQLLTLCNIFFSVFNCQHKWV